MLRRTCRHIWFLRYLSKWTSLPLTGNGKIDRRALPIPDANVSRGVSYVAPRNGTEQKVADIWAQVLQAEQVGVYDHFFDIGGHSLAGMKMLALVHQELGVEPVTQGSLPITDG